MSVKRTNGKLQLGMTGSCVVVLFCLLAAFPTKAAPKLGIEYQDQNGQRFMSIELMLDSGAGDSTLSYAGHRIALVLDNEPCSFALPRYSMFLAVPVDATPELAEVETVFGESVSADVSVNPRLHGKADEMGVVRVEDIDCAAPYPHTSIPQIPVRIRTVAILRDYKVLLLDLFTGTYSAQSGVFHRFVSVKFRVALGAGSFRIRQYGGSFGQAPPGSHSAPGQIFRWPTRARTSPTARVDDASKRAGQAATVGGHCGKGAGPAGIDVARSGDVAVAHNRLFPWPGKPPSCARSAQ